MSSPQLFREAVGLFGRSAVSRRNETMVPLLSAASVVTKNGRETGYFEGDGLLRTAKQYGSAGEVLYNFKMPRNAAELWA